MSNTSFCDHKVVVCLYDMSGLGVIITCDSNVVYFNQTGGYSCHENSAEGIFIPLSTMPGLDDFFMGPKWNGWCCNGIDEESADYMDGLFQKHQATRFLRVDRTRLRSCEEAWIHVVIEDVPSSYLPFSGISTKYAILTWPNSD